MNIRWSISGGVLQVRDMYDATASPSACGEGRSKGGADVAEIAGVQDHLSPTVRSGEGDEGCRAVCNPWRRLSINRW